MPRSEKEPLTEKVLTFLAEKSLEFLDLGLSIMLDPKEAIRAGGMTSYKSSVWASRIIYNLKRSPYFEAQGEKLYVTEKGRMKIIRNIIQNKKKDSKKWNGFWLGIIFDIKETNRKERAFLRRELYSAGCSELQKSVWITHLDIEKELLALLQLWKKDFNGDIRFLKIKEISDQDQLKKRFKIT